ncbi:glycosyltransferase [Halpernia frigidisoli]|uniref:Glycosyltransferase involved in cell wall bisynthesis n=1 Tax=Halpernia frigidisoli TaxID=1125876 RepID=A0A1I3I275_9FLAO|nr:glycosyltransferase [Halpernia frigidisoli]SFI42041.1 Glycosyltransferase involved in cell wall bisynthesis [Halpernia frigidisoli]
MKYKILFISSWFPNKLEPTNGNFVQKHAEAVALYNDVEILHAVGDFYQKEKFLIDDKTVNGLRTLIVYYKNTHNPLLNFARRMSAYKRGFGKLQKPDLVHANVLHNSMLFAIYLKKKHKISFIVSEHWSAFRKEAYYKTPTNIKYFARKIANEAAIISPVSNDLKKGLQHLGIDATYKVVPNTVDTSLFYPKSSDNPVFTFLHISNLVPLKNADKILLAALKLFENGYKFKIKIGGDGTDVQLSTLKKIAESSNFSQNIEIFGLQKSCEVAEKMRNADCFILFSDNENQPCVIPEAFASGISVISTSVGGISEFFPKGFGILLDEPKQKLLQNAMVEIMNKKTDNAQKEIMVDYVKNNFSLEKIGVSFSELYSQILK